MHRSCTESVHKRLLSSNARLDMVSVLAHLEGSSSLVYIQRAQGNPSVDNCLLLIGHADIQRPVDSTVADDLLSFSHLQYNIISRASAPSLFYD